MKERLGSESATRTAIAAEKNQRARRAETQNPRIRTHRFIPPADPFLLSRLCAVRDAAEQLSLSGECPSFVGLGGYGSYMFGYAERNGSRESDLDFVIYTDNSRASSRLPQGGEKGALSRLSGVPEGLLHLYFQDVTPDVIRRYLTLDIANEYVAGPLANLFLCSTGVDLHPYRELVFKELESRGVKGQEQWDKIMTALWSAENSRFSPDVREARKALYPSLADARRVFLGSSSELEKLLTTDVP